MRLRPVLAVALIVTLGIGLSFALVALVGNHGPPSVTTVDQSHLTSGNGDNGISDSTSAVVRVGRGPNLVVVRVVNTSPSNRTLRVTLDHDETDTRLIDQRRSFQANETLRINVREPAQYTVRVRDVETNASKTATITTERFDCNDHRLTFRVIPNETIERTWISTAMECG